MEITADAFPEANFEGEVVRIATKGTDTSNVVTFDVKIEVFGKGKEKTKTRNDSKRGYSCFR